MSNSIKDHIATELQKAKATTGTRATRIQAIIKDAAAQVLTEVKAGSGEVGTIAKTSLEGVADSLDQQPKLPAAAQEGFETAVPVEPSLKDLLFRVLNAVKLRVFNRTKQTSTSFGTQYLEFLKSEAADLKQQVGNLDAGLEKRYGDRYSVWKQRAGRAKAWYQETAARQVETGTVTVLEQTQAGAEQRVGEFGTSVARRELKLRQQLKDLLQTAASKL